MPQIFIDLSHTVEDGMITYKGLPAPAICDFWTRAESRRHYTGDTSFHIGRIDMVANTGTYIDSPFHRFAGGKDLSELDLLKLANLEGIVVRAAGLGRAIGPELFAGLNLTGKAVLIHTRWDVHWHTDQYFEGHPFLTAAAADHLVANGARLVGIDSLNIDDTEDGLRPVHTILLSHEIPIVEHLCSLELLPDNDFRFFAAPVKVKGMGSFPVRAFAIV